MSSIYNCFKSQTKIESEYEYEHEHEPSHIVSCNSVICYGLRRRGKSSSIYDTIKLLQNQDKQRLILVKMCINKSKKDIYDELLPELHNIIYNLLYESSLFLRCIII